MVSNDQVPVEVNRVLHGMFPGVLILSGPILPAS
jgi:hypothetical protein